MERRPLSGASSHPIFFLFFSFLFFFLLPMPLRRVRLRGAPAREA